jgi:TRAP-type mannitol/chloroaromatic compound transport system substrate-binding protein
MIERRRFIAKASGMMAAIAAAIVDAPNVIAQPKVQWRMSTAWTPALDMLEGAAQRLAKVVGRCAGRSTTLPKSFRSMASRITT